MNAERLKEIIGILFVPATILIAFGISLFGEGQRDLDIIANLSPATENNFVLRGRVLNDGDPVSNAQVWAVLKDARSNKDSPPAVTTDQQGEFRIDSIPQTIGKEKVTEVIIYAKAQLTKSGDKNKETATIRGEEILTITGVGSPRTVKLSVRAVILLPTIFLISMIVPFVRLLSPQWKYGFAITLAFLFTVAMIVSISLGLNYVNTTSDKSEILSLGFASIFHGTYVEGVQKEWLLSLTSPQELPDQSTNGGTNIFTGFGVPLWVLLLSVIGASLFTVLLIVTEIKDRPNLDKLKKEPQNAPELNKFRERIEKIVRHQFYMLFSPLGAIFIYQLLIAAEAAAQPVTVAIAALGSGASLNIILDKAVTLSKTALEKVT